jgi:sugar fermentation stimulation protein A
LPFQKEVKIWESRIDFLINDNIWVEIKGCSLIEGDTGFFPDAPTKRGAKHIEELFQIIKNWWKAEIRFLPVDNITYFSPNTKTDPLFSEKFYQFIKYWGKVKFLKINFNFKKDKANIYLQSLPNVKII